MNWVRIGHFEMKNCQKDLNIEELIDFDEIRLVLFTSKNL